MAVVDKTVVALPVQYVELELSVYKRYSRQGTVYEAAQAYRFTEEQASVLLREIADDGRPLWRRYTPRPIQQQLNSGVKNVVDATQNKVKDISDPDGNLISQKRIEIGTEEEIKELLGENAVEV